MASFVVLEHSGGRKSRRSLFCACDVAEGLFGAGAAQTPLPAPRCAERRHHSAVEKERKEKMALQERKTRP